MWVVRVVRVVAMKDAQLSARVVVVAKEQTATAPRRRR